MSKRPKKPKSKAKKEYKVAMILAFFLAFATLSGMAKASYVVQNASYNVLALPFDENTGTVAYDYSGLGHNVSDASANWTTGIYDTALGFNEVHYGNFTSDGYMASPLITITAWIKTTQSGVGFVYYRGTGGCSGGVDVSVNTANANKFVFHTYGYGFVAGGTNVNDGAWHFVAVTYNGTHAQFYINNSANTIASDGITAYGNIELTTNDLVFVGSCGGPNSYGGTVDELQVWNTSLSQSDIQTVMNTPIASLPASPTETYLYLNDNQSNITLGNTTALNITALANISLPVDLYINDTLIQSGELIENVSYYPEGLYNITVEWVGNGSYSESNATWWANITYTPAPPTNYSSPYNVNTSWNWCISNNTLLNHMAIFNNGTFSQSNDTYTICEYGCENNICNDEPMISGLKIFGFIIVLFLIFMFLDKKVLK